MAHRGADSPIQTRGNQPRFSPGNRGFFLAPLVFPAEGGRAFLFTRAVFGTLWHTKRCISPSIRSGFFPDPIRTYLPYLARPRAHHDHDHQHPMQPTKTPKLGRIRVHDEEAHGAQGWDRGSDPGLVRRRRRRATRATGPRMLLPLFTLILAT